MATSRIKGSRKGGINAARGFTVSEVNVTQVGSLVSVSGYVNKSGGIGTTEVLIGTMTGVDFPSANLRAICGGGNQAYSPTEIAYIAINTAGEIRLKLNTSRPFAIFDVIYGV